MVVVKIDLGTTKVSGESFKKDQDGNFIIPNELILFWADEIKTMVDRKWDKQ